MRIGIILTGDYSWAGGVYYSLNIIKLLHGISLSRPLTVVAIVNSDTPAELINELPSGSTEISYLDNKSFFYKLYHKVAGNRFIADINALHLDVLYPLISYHPSHAKLNCRVFYWLYDFQHKFLPELFSTNEIKRRDITFEEIASLGKEVVFSSYDSKAHFEKFYPKSGINKHVYNFVSLVKPGAKHSDQSLHLPDNYFIVCNQFWPHKNHIIVLKALDQFLRNDGNSHIVFTGKFDNETHKDYVDELKKFIEQHHLQKHITLTGFISREAQVQLIMNARAVIQPSFFEGWSTVVEDAKALNKFLIASDINVNREQVKKNVLFFDPTDHLQLTTHLINLTVTEDITQPLDYKENIEVAKNELTKLFKI